MISIAAFLIALAQLTADPARACDQCAEWNQPQPAFRVYGDTWYVGTAGLAAILLTSSEGHILIDGGLPQSAPLIAQNIRQAGFRLEDVKLILNSHTHYDHAGGMAALQRATGAQVAASPAARQALENGGPLADDPQFGFGKQHNDFAPIANVRAVTDGETLRVGKLAITAHFTPGHTPGGTTWSWRSCEGARCLSLVYVDSLNSISAPGFRFTEGSRSGEFDRSISVVENLPCDILLAPHPAFMSLDVKLAAWKSNPAVNPFIGDGACRSYARGARQRLLTRLAEERAESAKATPTR
jgi:metallo-beta-lactamase class B